MDRMTPSAREKALDVLKSEVCGFLASREVLDVASSPGYISE